jgi:hypothetical protein
MLSPGHAIRKHTFGEISDFMAHHESGDLNEEQTPLADENDPMNMNLTPENYKSIVLNTPQVKWMSGGRVKAIKEFESTSNESKTF